MYYPYSRGKAGNLRTRYKTAKHSEYLLASREIVSLAQEILAGQEYLEAEDLAEKLTGTRREKDFARQRLMEIIKPPPKRPLYYAQHEIQYLPLWTRDALRYLGDFIDMLVKAAIHEKTRDSRIFRSSLGPAIDKFQAYWPNSKTLCDLLRKYNSFLYRGAKHDFTLPSGRRAHRFTSREVVLTAFITMNLADRITAVSTMAEKVRRDEQIL
jgi:hypothetical protein